MNNFPAYNGNLDWLKSRTIFLTKHGSHAYGTNLPTSDLDLKGIAIPPRPYFYGFASKFEQADGGFPDHDCAIYDIRKFFSLAADCNPNIIELLFTDPSDWLISSYYHELIYNIRESFLSKKARHTFAGYAHAQLKRIRTHQRWLRNPPAGKPTREEYGLPLTNVADKEQERAAEFLEAQGYGLETNFQYLVAQEKKYRQALKDWDSYERWRRERNPARHELEAKFGYDTKHAMHLVRLLRMCEEILATGKVNVRRPDAEELLAIRAGAWSFEELLDWAEKQDAKMEALYETSTLPHTPDRAFLEERCNEIVYLAMGPHTQFGLGYDASLWTRSV